VEAQNISTPNMQEFEEGKKKKKKLWKPMTNTMKMLLWDNFHSIFLLFSLPFTFPFLGFC
jgi:hypothetical protein